MSDEISAYAALSAGGPLQPWSYRPGPLATDEIEVAVEHCGICHSDLSVIDDEWGISRYPVVPGHEVVGSVVATGEQVRGLSVGDRVGIGWFAGSCLHCRQCTSGRHNLCPDAQATIVGHHGGFAERVRTQAAWAVRLPEGLDAADAGPLFCGGITVFAPIVECGVQPTDRVAVVGIGGLGHLALRFLSAWGCEVTALSSSPAKFDAARRLGAHHVASSTDAKALAALRGRFDFVLVTVNVPLDWPALLETLAPGGRLHVVGAVLEPMRIPAFSLIGGGKSLSGSPVGSPARVAQMLDFCARHGIAPNTEHFPMSRVNDAIARLRNERPGGRIILDADFQDG